MEVFLLRVLFLMCCILLVPSHAEKQTCSWFNEAGLLSGTYILNLEDGLLRFHALCDMDTAGGGWTVVQRRINGSVDFDRGLEHYEQGFGNIFREYWLGYDRLHRLTEAGLTTLRVDLEDWEGNTAYAQYDSFQVGPASDYYRLSVSGYSGTAGDSLTYQNGTAFSMNDPNRYLFPNTNCAVTATGAWWYYVCHISNLNGKYYVGGKSPFMVGINWSSWKGYFYSLKSTTMKVREP